MRRAVFRSCYRQAWTLLELNGGWGGLVDAPASASTEPAATSRTLLKVLSVVPWDGDGKTDLHSASVLKPVRIASHWTVAVHSIDVKTTTAYLGNSEASEIDPALSSREIQQRPENHYRAAGHRPLETDSRVPPRRLIQPDG